MEGHMWVSTAPEQPGRKADAMVSHISCSLFLRFCPSHQDVLREFLPTVNLGELSNTCP